ncbi:hypothetical protein RUM44_001592 [Polyplax serrata]|uniref:Uncharacterized protein n=1 Tax=Polyplax serrata TaxID=468196 RepID=A0ABR1AKI6_POLSC
MKSLFNLSFTVLASLLSIAYAGEEDAHLGNLLNAVKSALYSGASLDNLSRQPQDLYYSHNNGLSLGVYEALLSITRNDDLECVPRLLCEAAAGGSPGYSGRDVKFDKESLTKFISYLNLGPGSSSPLLTFAKAALLGVSNRGDPYSCIINYAKCPKDQSRLLHYLNNHRGGFFQYFDKKEYRPGNQYPFSQNQYQYRPGYGYNSGYPTKYTKNKIKFENLGHFIGNLKKKVTGTSTYANKYGYSSFRFPGSVNRFPKKESYNYGNTNNYNNYGHKKRMVFPEGLNPRIRNEPEAERIREGSFAFATESASSKFPKKVKFFPEDGNRDSRHESFEFVSDRLPVRADFRPSHFDQFTKFPEEGKQFFPQS